VIHMGQFWNMMYKWASVPRPGPLTRWSRWRTTVKHGRTASRSPALMLVHFKQYRGHWGNVWVKYLHHLKEYNVAYIVTNLGSREVIRGWNNWTQRINLQNI
jgi:hypothetical protein